MAKDTAVEIRPTIDFLLPYFLPILPSHQTTQMLCFDHELPLREADPENTKFVIYTLHIFNLYITEL